MTVLVNSAFLQPVPTGQTGKSKTIRMSPADVVEEVEWLMSFGFKGEYICDRLGRAESVLHRSLHRAGRLDLWHKMFAHREPDPVSVWANKYINKSKATRGKTA